MVRGQRLALQLAGRGSLLSGGARSPHRRGLGFYVSSEDISCSEANHLVASDIGFIPRLIPSEATHVNLSSNSSLELLNKNGYSQVVGTYSVSKGYQCLGFQKRGMSSLGQATKPSDEEKAAVVSASGDNVGGQGQLPPSQPLEGNLMPTSEEEEKIAPVLARSNLLITRNVEWANLALGFEQQNKYVILDPHQPQAPVGYIVEESNVLLRQVLRTRRPFVVSVLDANAEEVCRVTRPVFFINSSMSIEINGKVIGECHGRWHLWKRIYDVYIGNKQFATVENPGLWNWTFTLMDDSGGVLAQIDRNWRGFGFEFLTDAGQYAVRFGDVLPKGSIHHATPTSEEGEDRKPFLLTKNEKTGGAEMHELQEATDKVDALAVVRPLSLIERAVVLALAVSLDNDYFSQHSGHGVGNRLPLPFYTSEPVAAEQSPVGSSSNAESETGHEVFPRGDFQASRSENIAEDEQTFRLPKDDMPAEDPYHGMFDEPSGGDQNNAAPYSDSDFKWGQIFDDDPPNSDSGSGWGLGDWDVGSDDS